MPSIVARVNGQAIPLTHLRIISEKRLRAISAKTENRARVYRQALDELINRELLLQEAIARGMHADERLVEQAYDEKRSAQDDENAWRQTLAREGMTPASLRGEIRVQLTVQTLLAEVAAKELSQGVSDDDIRSYYERNPALFDTGEQCEISHILVQVPNGADAATKAALRQRIERLRARIEKGEDFAELARANSEDPTTRDNGGRLPPFGKSQSVEPFQETAFALKPGQVSDVVETRFGFHLIKSHRKLPSRRLSLAEAYQAIRGRLLNERRSATVSSFIEALKSRARIEIFL